MPRRLARTIAALTLLIAGVASVGSRTGGCTSRAIGTGSGGVPTVAHGRRRLEHGAGRLPQLRRGIRAIVTVEESSSTAGCASTRRWMPGRKPSGCPAATRPPAIRNRATLFLGVGQYRPWLQHGFFLKGGMGMGFVPQLGVRRGERQHAVVCGQGVGGDLRRGVGVSCGPPRRFPGLRQPARDHNRGPDDQHVRRRERDRQHLGRMAARWSSAESSARPSRGGRPVRSGRRRKPGVSNRGRWNPATMALRPHPPPRG